MGKIKLTYTAENGQEVTDHQCFHTAKSARIRAKHIRSTKAGSHDFRLILETGEEVKLTFSDPQ